MQKKCNHSLKAAFQHFILDTIIFDLWLLMEIRKLVIYFRKLCAPTCKVLLCASWGLMVTINMKSLNVHSTNVQFLKSNLVGITDLSKPDNSIIEQELLQVKDKAKYLEIMFYEMNSQVANLHLNKKTKELPDFASEAAGGFIIATPDTESYKKNTYISIFGVPLWNVNYYSPRKIIQPWTQAGECWSFKGHYGKIEIHLAYAIKLDSVTLEHIPVTVSLTGSINSAPKNFQIYGYFRQQYVLLDSFVYDIQGNPSQMFNIKNQEMRKVPIKRVLLEITSNWGNLEYTCVYRFKVHGDIFKLFDDNTMKNNPE